MMFAEELNCIKNLRVLVYKTNAPQSIDLASVADLFNNVEGIKEWNFDLEDCDRIFRVVAEGINPSTVVSLLKFINIEAIELED
jgi:hypothetical protein